jgi:hypothetical protein
MSNPVSVLVTEREKKILDGLRDLPEGDLKRTAEAFLLELSDQLANPRCASVQADGVPCGQAATDCEQCLTLKQLVQNMRGLLREVIA